jgi:hypothetical protein
VVAVTIRAISGLVVLNLFILSTGAGVLWGLRGWRWWTELVRLAGVAYVLGLAALMVLMSLELVVGVPVGSVTIALDGLALVAAGVLWRRARGGTWPGPSPVGWRFPRLSVFVALFVAGIVVYLEGMFRSERLSGVVNEFDSWAFWMPKAEWIYYVAGLDQNVLKLLPNGSYPPGLTSVQAAAFHAMGAADTASLHLQYWFLAVGFLAAVAGALAHRVRPTILVPALLAVMIAPSLAARAMTTYADIPLGYLVAGAALLMLLWVDEHEPWQLGGATLLLAAAMLTKREGILFAAAVVLAAFVASWGDSRRSWPRLAVAGVTAFALALPWRLWFTPQGIPSDAPSSGYVGSFEHLDRVWPSIRLVVTTLFDQDLWPFVSVLALAAILLAALARAWTVAVYSAAFVVGGVAASAWAIWSNTSLRLSEEDSLNPIVRLTGTTILVLAALTPPLLQSAWDGSRASTPVTSRRAAPGPDGILWRSLGAWAIVLVGVLSHPASMLLGYSGSGLPGGSPRFPGPGDCVVAPRSERPVRLVVGYTSSYPAALELRRRARRAGLGPVEMGQDGCGRVRVFIDDLATVAAGRRLAGIAHAAGLESTLELDTR